MVAAGAGAALGGAVHSASSSFSGTVGAGADVGDAAAVRKVVVAGTAIALVVAVGSAGIVRDGGAVGAGAEVFGALIFFVTCSSLAEGLTGVGFDRFFVIRES